MDDDDREEVTTKLTLRAYPAKVKLETRDGVALPRVDLKSDPRVFALLDEGCNRTCHTPAWAKHAMNVYARAGAELGSIQPKVKAYKGIGGCSTVGRRQIPFGLRLPDDKVVRGMLWSNELEHHPDRVDRILLLSLKA